MTTQVIVKSPNPNHQVGVTQEEFEHMQRAFGPGTWEAEVLVDIQGNDHEYFVI